MSPGTEGPGLENWEFDMSHPGALKRQKELARQEKKRLKDERREQRRKEKAERADSLDQNAIEDPDIAGIVPGPQPPYEE